MSNKLVLKPSSTHPIAIEKIDRRITVSVGGNTIADTTQALSLKEASHQPAIYIPREDVNMSLLERSNLKTYCPYKGEASYYSIPSGARGANAVWTYEAPHEAVVEIKDHVSFYPDRVDAIS